MSATETEQKADGMDEDDECPVCGDSYNHRVDNGFRNFWPTDVKFEVCTTSDSADMYVHTQDLIVDESDPFAEES